MITCRECGAAQDLALCTLCRSSMYGREHQAARRLWAPKVAAGIVVCCRCGKLIAPNAEWDLGHRYGRRHPEHRLCNRRAGRFSLA